MKAFFMGLVKGFIGCILILVLAVGICQFTGILDVREYIDRAETEEAEVPAVNVVESEPEEISSAVSSESDKEENVQGKTEPENSDSGIQAEISVGSEDEDETIRLLFAGDLYLTDVLQGKYRQKGIEAAATERLLNELEQADVFMLNQEFPFGTTGEPMEEKEYTFRISPEYVSVLQELSVDMVTLANNHMLDFGREPLAETFATLNQAGIPYVGAGENLEEAKRCKTLEVKGKTIGFLGASRVIPDYSWNATAHQSGLFTTYDPTQLLNEIRQAKENCDFVVVYVHWGIEQSEQPEDYQKDLGRQYIDAGADAVIGSHPHVLQEIEYYQDKPIVYSLGNFIFSNRPYETAMVELTLQEEGCEVRWVPCSSESNQMDLVEGSE